MEKEIMELVNGKEGSFRLNNISYLRRWTKDMLGHDVDKLELEFENINSVCFSLYDTEIKARDYEGIIKECSEITQNFLAEVSRELVTNMRAGYRNKKGF